MELTQTKHPDCEEMTKQGEIVKTMLIDLIQCYKEAVYSLSDLAEASERVSNCTIERKQAFSKPS